MCENRMEKEEWLACYDENGNRLESSVLRTVAHEKGILHGASHIYICKREGGILYVLLQRRSANKDSFPGCLDTSSAGHVEKGSSYLETAIKELYEELGLTVSADDLIELFNQTIDQKSVFHGKPFIDREINRVYLLISDPDPASLSLQSSEVSEVIWMPADRIMARLEDGDSSVCLNYEEFKRVLAAVARYL